MKKLLLICCILFLFSCGEDESPDLSGAEEALIVTLTSGDWVIDFFIRDDMEGTVEYENFIFSFKETGELEASISGQLIESGSWNTVINGGAIIMEIDFSTSATLSELNDDWFVVAFGDRIVELEEENDLDSVDEDRLIFVQR